jgi:imidazolonepropionase-like amidohydrolase
MRIVFIVVLVQTFLITVAWPQVAPQPQVMPRRVSVPQAPPGIVHPVVQDIHCGTLIDGRSGEPRKNVFITIEGEKVVKVSEARNYSKGPPALIDLSNETCLPGLTDTHTHVLLNGDITAADYDFQLLKESPEYRTILASVNARRALEYGFTAIRDLETEGAGYADVDVKKAINDGVIPGRGCRLRRGR